MAKLTFDAVNYTVGLSAENFGATQQYLATVVPTNIVTFDDILNSIVATRPYLDRDTARMVFETLISETRRHLSANIFTVTWGPFYLKPDISGSVASMDAAITEANKLRVSITVLPEFTKAMAAAKPNRLDDDEKLVIIDKVEDIATGATGKISLGGDFVLTGLNVSASHDGEWLKLVKGDGTILAAATVKAEDGKGQRITAAFDGETAVEPGKYKLCLRSRGYSTPLEGLKDYFVSVEIV